MTPTPTLFTDSAIEDKPFTILRKMKDNSCNKVPDDLLLELWIHRLPQQIQAILSGNTNPLDQQVQLADKIYETIDTTTIQALTHKNQMFDSDFTKQICKLEEKIDSLQKDINKSRSRNRSADSNRSYSRSDNRSNKKSTPWCWYHQTYKNKAQKCIPPCSYKNKEPKN